MTHRVIGTFQALQHRAADLFMELQLCRTVVMVAARQLDDNDMAAPQGASAAKARCSDFVVKMMNEALQMHGGIGITHEHDIGFFMKRARVCQLTFGDSAFHKDRWATLNGY